MNRSERLDASQAELAKHIQLLAADISLSFLRAFARMQFVYKSVGHGPFWTEFETDLNATIERGLRESLQHLLDIDQAWLKRTGRAVPYVSVEEVYQQYLTDTRYRFKKLTGASRAAIERAVRNWERNQEPVEALYERLRKYFSEDRALRIARTELAAANAARVKMEMRKLHITRWTWRTNPYTKSGVCGECRDREGRTYTTRHRYPPLHPNCGCEAEPEGW